MKYCSSCGKPVDYLVPDGDNRKRHVCDHCDTIHYQNPKNVVGCLPVWEDKVLLCKRAIEPCYGLWTLPAGFMENGESLEEAALRESREEANANLAIDGLYSVISLPHMNQVYILYRAHLLDLDFSAGSESLDVRLFSEEDIPWEELAFQTIVQTLEHYFKERASGIFTLHTDTLSKPNRKTEQ